MKKSVMTLSLLLVLSISLAGCNLPGRQTPTTQVDLLNTAAAQTIQAQQTIIAQTSQPTVEVVIPTSTLTTPVEEGTATETPQPSHTPAFTATMTQQTECDQVGFVSETIPDGTDFTPGQTFTKTWTLKNTGSCTWNADYDVVFVSGASMDAPAATPITSGTVAPGQTVTVSFDLKAPIAAGTHRGEFKLRNANGVIFGIGEKHNPFWVEIDVKGTLFDFTENVCASGVTWTTNSGTLPCPGTPGDAQGWVKKIGNPTLENGIEDDEPGIQVHPEMVNDGWIKGTYTEIAVTGGVYFRAIIGCYDDSDCDVKFKLNYIITGDSEKTLATWREVQDGNFNRVKVDLSSLAGKNVRFILVVEANGSASNDKALWFGARIEP